MKLKIDLGVGAKKFSTLEVGDVFEHGGQVYVKTKNIWVSHNKPNASTGYTYVSLDCSHYNAFDFAKSESCKFNDDVYVHEINEPVFKGSL